MSWPERIVIEPEVLAGKPIVRGTRLAVEFILELLRKISLIADYSHRCSKETAAFSCEMAVHLDAFNKLGLLKRFTTFACHEYKRIEP
jgi:hypothetical protein